MKRWNIRSVACGALAVVVLAPGVGAEPSKNRFALISAVPDNVFLCSAERNNPKREFIDQYWREVFDELVATGVATDVIELLTGFLGDEGQAELTRLKARATELIAGVAWRGLAAGEIVFAERMGVLQQVERGIDIGPPEFVFLIKGTEAEQNFTGIVAIIEALADEINKLKEGVIVVEHGVRAGLDTVTLRPAKLPDDAPELSFSIARTGDVIIVSWGRPLFDDVAGLLGGRGSGKSLASNPRFQSAFANLPEASDSLFFFDMQRMLKPITGAIKKAIASHQGDAIKQLKSLYGRRTGRAIDSEALEAYNQEDYAKALELIHVAHKTAPKDSRVMYNVACFEAINGHREEALTWLERCVNHGFSDPRQMAKDSDLESLRNDARFVASLEKAKRGFEEISAKKVSGEVTEGWARIATRLADVPGIMDYVAVVTTTDGHRTVEDKYLALVPNAASNPFYPVFGKRESLTNYDRFLPVETSSFSVCGGFDLSELYGFVEETVAMAGDEGKALLAQWAGIQQSAGFDVRRDLLSWLVGDTISVSFKTDAGDQWVEMIKVSDEPAAALKLKAVLDGVSAALQQAATKNPMLGMIALRTAPATHEKLSGFHAVSIGMSQTPMTCGVAQGYIMVGSSQDAVALCLATAAGEHPNIRKNARVMKEALLPDGPFRMLSYKDDRDFGKNISQMLAMVPMIGGLAAMGIPDPEVQQLVGKVMGIVAKLSPVAAKIDFYQSSGSYSTFDGQGWRTKCVTNYVDPAERATATAGR